MENCCSYKEGLKVQTYYSCAMDLQYYHNYATAGLKKISADAHLSFNS